MQDILHFVQTAPLESLFEQTARLRETHFGNRVETCMIVNAKSGCCPNDCKFCSQSGHYSTSVPTFSLLPIAELTTAYRNTESAQVKRFGIVTSGQTVSQTELDEICTFISTAKQTGKTEICASLGQLNRNSLTQLKAAGMVRYHHNLETSRNFYPSICGTQNWQDRMRTVRTATEIGLDVCSGGLFGLGETWRDRVDLALTLKELNVTSIPMNFYHAQSQTPFAELEPLSAEEALRIIALFRLLLPETSLRICGGRPKILGDHQHQIFAAGADALMTGNYLTTTGITPESDQAMILSQGLEKK